MAPPDLTGAAVSGARAKQRELSMAGNCTPRSVRDPFPRQCPPLLSIASAHRRYWPALLLSLTARLLLRHTHPHALVGRAGIERLRVHDVPTRCRRWGSHQMRAARCPDQAECGGDTACPCASAPRSVELRGGPKRRQVKKLRSWTCSATCAAERACAATHWRAGGDSST